MPLGYAQRQAVEIVQAQLWNFYQDLKTYKTLNPQQQQQLHNNASEQDLREFVTKRKISGSTRSESGRRCRDTFASLKKTCRKLGVSFWEYLTDRVSGKNLIPTLGVLIAQKAMGSQCPLAEKISLSSA